ncbi:MAG: hypothetical protein EOO43_09855 [Flavobacterium sp.]|nr:MAG: hypothetical protein EOO43_09855 [Flavobacterium sp.]
MSFEVKQLKNNRIRVQLCRPEHVECHYAYTGGKINVKTLKSMISNGYSRKPKDKDTIDGYVLDKELSGERAQVYHNPETNHLVVNHRGTQGLHDVITDIRLMFGDKSNKRFQHGKTITDKALKKYDTDYVTMTGHSLGASVAKEANKEHGKETIVVNPAVVPTDLTTKQRKNDTIIRSTLDPISMLRNLNPWRSKKNTIDIKAKSINPLTEHSSKVLDRLGDRDVGI